jgi:hypothetical protein
MDGTTLLVIILIPGLFLFGAYRLMRIKPFGKKLFLAIASCLVVGNIIHISVLEHTYGSHFGKGVQYLFILYLSVILFLVFAFIYRAVIRAKDR